MRRAVATDETVVNFPNPKRPQPPATRPDEHTPRHRFGKDDGSVNILIVDDEPTNLTVLEAVLNNPAYRLVRAASADQALLALLVDQFAVLILDIRMPGITGIELAQMVKERKKTAQVPIIFLTAYYNEDQHVMKGYGAGAVDYLHKPVNPDILRSKVAVFAELYRMQRELRASNEALLAEIAERRRAQDELRQLNETLEHRVLERTQALRASAALLQMATNNASVGLATFSREHRYVFANPAYYKLFDLPPDLAGRDASELLGPLYPEQVAPLLDRALAGDRVSCDLRRPASGTRESSVYSIVYEPERDESGQIVGVVVVVFDITDRKRAEDQIRLLLSEVNHRSKNLLSVVLAIAQQTRASRSEEFVQLFSDRIQALAASHDLLAKSQWQRIEMFELVRAQLAHFQDLLGGRIGLDGPTLHVSVAGAQCIGMVIHELATNAIKHGALSDQVGRVDIAWNVETRGREEQFTITWVESCGPIVSPPSVRGFGSTVITSMAELSLDALVRLDFPSTGLRWHLACPVIKIMAGGMEPGEDIG